MGSGVSRYLIRFDDLCPTMNWKAWDRVERLLDDNGIQPLLALIPDNADEKMRFESPNPAFWERARGWAAKGWVIGQHGYRHLYDSANAGLVPWWRQSEFAGLARPVQEQRVVDGLRRMRGEGLAPKVWVAPSHSFDATTLDVLRENGFEAVSDGFGFRPYRDRRGLVWVPLRPWEAPGSRSQTRTLCFHHNTLTDFSVLERAVGRHRERCMGVAFQFRDVLAEAGAKAFPDSVSEGLYGALFAGRRAVRGLARGRRAA